MAPQAQDQMKDGNGQDKQDKHTEKKAENDDQAAPLPEKVGILSSRSACCCGLMAPTRAFCVLPIHMLIIRVR